MKNMRQSQFQIQVLFWNNYKISKKQGALA